MGAINMQSEQFDYQTYFYRAKCSPNPSMNYKRKIALVLIRELGFFHFRRCLFLNFQLFC
jgi:hypothetical protein